MKKYSLIKKANSRRTLLIKRLVLTGIFCLIVGSLLLVVPTLIRGVTAVVWYPFDQVRIWIAHSGSSLPQYIRDRATLVEEIEGLKIKMATEAGTENTIKKLQIENDQFREQIGAVADARVLARVIGRPNQLPYDMIMLDRGHENGVVEGAPVFLGSDQVIGFVSKVFTSTSLVTLVTTAGFNSSAYVFGPNIYTEAQGIGGGVLRVRIPQGILLQAGDLVVLPALDSGVYGAVSLVETSPTQPEQYGYVMADIPLQSLYYVTVGTTPLVTHSFAEAQAVVAEVGSKLFSVAVPFEVLVTPETSTTTVEQRPAAVPSAASARTIPTSSATTTRLPRL